MEVTGTCGHHLRSTCSSNWPILPHKVSLSLSLSRMDDLTPSLPPPDLSQVRAWVFFAADTPPAGRHGHMSRPINCSCLGSLVFRSRRFVIFIGCSRDGNTSDSVATSMSTRFKSQPMSVQEIVCPANHLSLFDINTANLVIIDQ